MPVLQKNQMTTLQTPQPETVAQPSPAIEAAGAAATWTQRKYRSSESISRRQEIIAYTLLVVGAIAFLIPFYFVDNASLKTDAAVQSGDFITPPKTFAD